MMLSNNSDAPSIDCEAPCAKEGGKAKKASPIDEYCLLIYENLY